MGLFAMSKKCFDRSSTVEKDFPKQSNITPSRTLQQHGCASRMSLRRCSRISQHTYTHSCCKTDATRSILAWMVSSNRSGYQDFHYLLCSHCFHLQRKQKKIIIMFRKIVASFLVAISGVRALDDRLSKVRACVVKSSDTTMRMVLKCLTKRRCSQPWSTNRFLSLLLQNLIF